MSVRMVSVVSGAHLPGVAAARPVYRDALRLAFLTATTRGDNALSFDVHIAVRRHAASMLGGGSKRAGCEPQRACCAPRACCELSGDLEQGRAGAKR